MLARTSLVAFRRVAPLTLGLQMKPVSTAPKRSFTVGSFAGNLAHHCTQLQGCVSLSSVLYSPLGTAMLLVLAYNVVVIGTKHINYSMEITAKDYVQDQQLYVIMRYGILACILLGMEVMFIEI
ncbi:hypothetical protein AGDE_14671 [Angomonas deanei]|uniref:Uncharacterized protein n=1 Tax=Angomonas deanei TaxID=59799 RepID=A0A7G2CFD7_9TRYP|nr:hypothetical protein AGDE_14671 [Angomonas deanei]CAD2217737.1 hypothetical protein, conserved [Angomonas deanei]|eukprot:EPY20442.1 hypothetical protein AGDE_14671 [Angomonas deanei]